MQEFYKTPLEARDYEEMRNLYIFLFDSILIITLIDSLEIR